MLLLKFEDHFFEMYKELYEDEIGSDILIKTETKTLSAHSVLLLQHIELLPSLMCSMSTSGHEKTVIIVTGFETEFVELALMEFYLHRDPTKLKHLFYGNSEEEHQTYGKDFKSAEKMYIEKEKIDDLAEEQTLTDNNAYIAYLEKDMINDINKDNSPVETNTSIAYIKKDIINDIDKENSPPERDTCIAYIEKEKIYDINEEHTSIASNNKLKKNEAIFEHDLLTKNVVKNPEDKGVPGVSNTTLYPVPENIKEALMENNKDRGLKFTLSNLMNDQMLLGILL